MLLGLFLRLTLLSVGIDQVIAPAPPQVPSRLPARFGVKLDEPFPADTIQHVRDRNRQDYATKPEIDSVFAEQEPAALPFRPRMSSPLSGISPKRSNHAVQVENDWSPGSQRKHEFLITSQSTAADTKSSKKTESVYRKTVAVRNVDSQYDRRLFLLQEYPERWHQLRREAQKKKAELRVKQKMDSNRQPQVESYQDDEFLEDQSLEDRYGNHKIWDEELAFGIAWHKRHQLELRSFSKQNPFYTTTKAQHKSYMITINAWTARLTDDHNTGIADFQYLVTQSQVNLMKAMMPEEFSKSIVAASTQHLAWCLDPIQDAYHFWQMATFANWMNGFLLSKWSETRYEETYHSLVLHLSPVLPVLEFYGAAFPTISSAVELSMQISRVQQQVFALRAIDKLISQAREKRRRALYAGRSYRKSPAIRFYEGLIQPSHLSQAKQGLHQVAILQVLSRYAIRILPEIQRADTKAKSEMKRDDIYDTWLKLREAHVQEINAAPDGAEMSQAKASTAESSESKPASDEAVLLSNILLCLGLETSQLPDLAVLEDSHGDFLEFYHSLYDLHAPSLRDQMTMVEVRISQAQDSITVFRRQSWIRESMKLGGDRSRSKIIQGALPVLDENAKTFLPKDFRRQKPEHGDGRFPILPSEIHQQVVDLSHFVESVKKLWPPEAWGDSGKTGNFFSSAVIYRATRRIDRKYGQYRVLNQYLKLASGEKR